MESRKWEAAKEKGTERINIKLVDLYQHINVNKPNTSIIALNVSSSLIHTPRFPECKTIKNKNKQTKKQLYVLSGSHVL